MNKIMLNMALVLIGIGLAGFMLIAFAKYLALLVAAIFISTLLFSIYSIVVNAKN